MNASSVEFRAVMGSYPTGVVVVAGHSDEGEPVGMAVNSFASLSLDPPLIVFCPADSSRSWRQIAPSGRFSVSILTEQGANACTVLAGRSNDKFRQVDWHVGPEQLPALDDSVAVLACEVEAVHPGGDHKIVVGRVVSLERAADARPLVYYQGSYVSLEI